MNEKNHFNIQIPTALAKKIKKHIEGTEFPSIFSYVTYILGGKLKPSFLPLKSSHKNLDMTNSPVCVQYILYISSCGLSKCFKQLDYIW